MTEQNSTTTVQEAQKLLKSFNCIEGKSVKSESERALIRQALLLLREHSDYQIFGICADTTSQGLLALKSYLNAFKYEPNPDMAAVEGAVYIKFNPNIGLCYLNSYTGSDRGVLVSFQSSVAGEVNELYGHLPLDLFILNE